MTCDDKCGLVCNRHVESLLLWPKRKAVAHGQEFQFSLNPPKCGTDRTKDASYYRCSVNFESKLSPVRFSREKSVSPFRLAENPTKRFRSSLHVTLLRRDGLVEIDNQNFKRSLEVIS